MLDWSDAQSFGLSLLPGLFWIVYLRSLSRGRVCSWWLWGVALAAGWASAQLTLVLSPALSIESLHRVPYFGSLLFYVFGVGLVEEGSKAVCALMALKVPKLIEKPLTALQLCGGVALGFATTENLLYAQQFGDGVIVLRFVTSTLAHILFASVWGFALGAQKKVDAATGEERTRTPWILFLKLALLSALAHGLYDWFIFSQRPVLALLTMIVLWLGFREAIVGAYLNQEYQRDLPFDTKLCPSCGVLTRAEGCYCSFCGQAMPSQADGF